MPSLYSGNLNKRYWYYGDGSNNNARWACFALFILVVVFLLLYTLRINKKRLRHGSKPIAGTSWMTPPSYFQSQAQYNEPLNSNNVPPYSANALPNDAGYYDANGNFIANPGYQPQQPPKSGVVNDYTGDTSNIPPHDIDDEFRRPSMPPPTHVHTTGNTMNTTPDVEYGFNGLQRGSSSSQNNNGSHYTDEELEMHDFTRPVGPPPTATRKN